ncbi:MAG: 16S rRNA (cytidine(1402)-2'-O)-methyltransferase [Candidatus Magasanikbacteria bacterium RIFCSPHIGHO2_01_FULL_50_8]|uniref:Ribosomal RNA small subunit methyltransferase I n=2 Tax=Candidatus Magasanikiibacteriota TaxID=1752731 RepID=A0A1F6LVD5_9BACT|nr:MAG: 16S rRNA (cytidine(1402)-2'-O)-methyltransferase [Candidatus Magasanikbacteria bacterium RIFCSPHIGHO2_01_FULL_50_8]OGH67583.1 MAG: 16S rRNA (cytidine(1402)-2'-O)-methyltransferase [Candidatus Magasanikbacteria bacterium RIFCSPHIGHO2_02_FULL_50_9b]
MKLYVVATPIGNLEDITPRARGILSCVPLVFAEDTRVTAKLLAHIGATPSVMSLHHHSTSREMDRAAMALQEAGTAALVSDAGTPGISDPGNLFIAELLRRGVELTISPIPGPSSITAALSLCGFPTDRFRALGFAPHKNKRNKFFDEVAATKETVVLLESVHRIKKTLADLARVCGDRPMMVGRELTKIHETVYRGSASEIDEQLLKTETRGEFVIVISSL